MRGIFVLFGAKHWGPKRNPSIETDFQKMGSQMGSHYLVALLAYSCFYLPFNRDSPPRGLLAIKIRLGGLFTSRPKRVSKRGV